MSCGNAEDHTKVLAIVPSACLQESTRPLPQPWPAASGPLASALRPLPVRGFLKWIGAVSKQVTANLPEEDAAKPLLHGPFGLDAHGFRVVVADYHRLVGRDQPGGLGLVVPPAGPAFLHEFLEVAVVAASRAR